MKDELKPLIKKETEASTSSTSDDDHIEHEAAEPEIKLNVFHSTTYGTNLIGKTVPHDQRITYAWNDLNVYTSVNQQRRFFGRNRNWRPQRKHIVKNANGIARPGELLAILGSSGAGKTTLLNALTFRSPKSVLVTGSRFVNGSRVNLGSFTSQSAYIQQDDLFIGNLTVKEHLIFQSLVRMDKNLSYEQRIRRVEEVISELVLTKCENTKIGIPGRIKGISGGERKRLSFAAEVLTNPALMFCDEPTSGLDSFMALNVVQVLKSLAQTGKTIVCTIHQPSSELYAMFDKLLLMAEGKCAFLATPEEADVFFTQLEAPCPRNYNPADYFIQLLGVIPGREESCLQAIDMICDSYEKSPYFAAILKEITPQSQIESEYFDFWQSSEFYQSPYKSSCFAQFRAVLWRSWLSVIREPLLIKVRILQTLMIALLVGLIYFGQTLNEDGVMNINGVLFIFLTNMTFQNVFAAVNVFCSELPIFLREHRNGMYRTDIYFICKTLAETPLFTLIPIIFTSISYYMIGLNPDFYKFLITMAILVLVTNVCTSFGYMISCFSSSVSMALSVGPPLIIPFLLFGGFFLNVNSIPSYFKWLSYFSWFRYANEALLINQWDDVESISCSSVNSTCPKNGTAVLEIYNFKEDRFDMDFVGLFALILIFRLLAYFALLFRTFRLK